MPMLAKQMTNDFLRGIAGSQSHHQEMFALTAEEKQAARAKSLEGATFNMNKNALFKRFATAIEVKTKKQVAACSLFNLGFNMGG